MHKGDSMAEQEGRWATVNGAHVFIKNGESENPFANMKKAVEKKESNSTENFRERAMRKVKATRDFIEKTVKEINDFNAKKRDPNSGEIGVSNSDLQAMVEAFGAEWGFSASDEERTLDEIRARTNMSGASQAMKEKYEQNAKINKAYWERQNLQKYNAHPMEGIKDEDLTDKQKAKLNEYLRSEKHLYK